MSYFLDGKGIHGGIPFDANLGFWDNQNRNGPGTPELRTTGFGSIRCMSVFPYTYPNHNHILFCTTFTICISISEFDIEEHCAMCATTKPPSPSAPITDWVSVKM